MAKRKTETSEYDTRSVRYAQRCKKTESASVCVKSEESSSESDDDEQTEFDIEMLEDKVDRMTKNLAYLKEGKARISKLKSAVADEAKKVDAKEKLLKTLQDEKPVIEQRRVLFDLYPEVISDMMATAQHHGRMIENPYEETKSQNMERTVNVRNSLNYSSIKLSELTKKLNDEQSEFALKEKTLGSLTANIVLGKTVEKTVIKEVEVEKKKKCGVCLEEYNTTCVIEANIKVCGHRYCRGCLMEICENANFRSIYNHWAHVRSRRVPPKCPSCQKNFTTSDILKIFN